MRGTQGDVELVTFSVVVEAWSRGVKAEVIVRREDPVLSPGTKLGQFEIVGHAGSGGIRPLDKEGTRV